MEISPVAGRFPAIPLRFGEITRSFSTQIAPTSSPLCPYLASTSLPYNADTVKLESRNRMFIFGMGFVGQFFAQELKKQGWVVSGTCTDLVKKQQLEEMGFNVYVFHANEPDAIDTIIKQEPFSDAQRMRSSGHYTSRVHVADICQALNASVHKPSLGKIYNIVDDDPAPRIEVFTFARNLVEKKWPGRIKQATFSDRADSFIPKGSSRGEKRVSNARMKKELGVRLIHADYKSGLQSIIESMDYPFLYNQSGS